MIGLTKLNLVLRIWDKFKVNIERMFRQTLVQLIKNAVAIKKNSLKV